MRNKKIFIGWSGEENREIAQRVRNLLSEANFTPIVGGESRNSPTINQEIMQQMNSCEYAILLIEKEIKKNENGKIISIGLNPNVMIELGYMLRRIPDHTRVRRILINMNPSELPSNLQGMWTVQIKKDTYKKGNIKKREKIINEVATKVAEDFFEYIRHGAKVADKLDYFDNWQENLHDIDHFTGNVRISDKLIFGMQASIYVGGYERLYHQLENIKDRLSQSEPIGVPAFREEHLSVIKCAMAILNVFITTRRLTAALNIKDFSNLITDLNITYEQNIRDSDLRAWCNIFRLDKLELCYEMHALTLDNTNKKALLGEALNLCNEILTKIDEQVASNPADTNYAMIYRAFTNRNISQIHAQLAQLEPELSETHLAMQKEYCKKTLENRRELFEAYKMGARSNALTMDYISQEYLLALAEQYKFEDSNTEKNKIENIARTIYAPWKQHIQSRNMIFDKVFEEASEFLESDN